MPKTRHPDQVWSPAPAPKLPARVVQSPLTKQFYAVTRYRVLEGGMLDAQVKHDVTADVRALLFHFAGDLWSTLDGMRDHWSELPEASLIERYIELFEEAAGIGEGYDPKGPGT